MNLNEVMLGTYSTALLDTKHYLPWLFSISHPFHTQLQLQKQTTEQN